jgi:uncharacterized peroxidase-related enzyme
LYSNSASALARGALDEAGLAIEERAMLDYAAKLTLSPSDMIDDDTHRLRAAGLDDEQIWEATFTVSIFNMFNRMADAFGLEPPASAAATLE